MLVSHFELLWKRQSPAAPVDPKPEGKEINRLIQGYFLEITNLEDKSIRFSLTLKAAGVTNTKRSLADNTLVFVDTPGVDNAAGVLNGALSSSEFYPSKGYIEVPAGATALVAVLPSAFGLIPSAPGSTTFLDPTPLGAEESLEVRGHVELRVPVLIDFVPGGGPFSRIRFVRQSETPVKVLLTPQNRSTYYRADGTVAAQTQATLPLAEGKAQSEIVAESSLRFIDSFSIDPERLRRVDLTNPARMEALVPLLAAIAADKEAKSAFNAALAESGLGVAIEAREVRQRE